MNMRFLKVCLLLAMGVGLAGAAGAQTGVYGEFTGAKLSANNSKWMFGPTVGLFHDSGHGLLATGLDVRGTFASRGNESLDTLLGGVRLAITPRALPLKPYGEVLGGLGHVKVGQSTSNKFAYQFIAGLDDTILPRLDWRVVEFSYGRLAGLSDSYAPKTISTGLVLRLP
jgi:hypothetical protein